MDINDTVATESYFHKKKKKLHYCVVEGCQNHRIIEWFELEETLKIT